MDTHQKTVLLIAHDALPIPDLYGGAIEFLITRLLEENEKTGKIRFVVTSSSSGETNLNRYLHSKVYCFENNVLFGLNADHPFRRWERYRKRVRLTNKLLHNRISKHIFGNAKTTVDYVSFQLLLLIKKERPDCAVVELCHNIDGLKPAIKKIGKKHTYYHIHCHLQQDMKIRSVIPNSISISEFVRKEWVVDSSIKGKNLVLYNCADLPAFKIEYKESKKEEIRRCLKINKDEIVVLFCGRLIPAKGIKQLLDAMDRLKDQRIRLLLIGSERFAQGNVSAFSKQIAERAERMENVIRLGYIPNKELSQYFSISEIQVIPSVWQEGAGIVAIEGMASGIPLIITDSGGMVEYVNDKCAVKVPISDRLDKDLADEILRLANDKDLRKKMGLAGKMRAEEFSSEKYYQGFIEIVD